MNRDSALASDALLEQAERRGRARLVSDPDNPTLLESLAEVYRKQGKLREAAALYERLTAVRPDDLHVRYTHAILSGKVWSDRPVSIQPSPFVLLDNFLPTSLHDSLMPFMIAARERLTPAMVGDGEYDPKGRESLELRENVDIEQLVAQHIREVLPAILSKLHVDPFETGQFEVMLRVYLDGHFFRVHRDNPADSPLTCNRRVSYVYFYHRVPRAYTGGELLLFDTDLGQDRYTTAGFTRVRPEDNSIVFFPSGCFHSVVPVRCPSKQFVDSRFTINGHISRRAPTAVDAARGAVSVVETASAAAP